MLAQLVLLTLSAAPSPGAPLAVGLTGVKLENVDARAGEAYLLRVREELSKLGVKALDLDLRGIACTDAGDGCEAAGAAQAANADCALLMAIGKFAGKYQVSMRLVSARDGATLSSYSQPAYSDEGVLEAMATGARAMAEEAAQKLGRELKQAKPEPQAEPKPEPKPKPVAAAPTPAPQTTPEGTVAPPPRRSWIPLLGGGVILTGLGVGAAFLAKADHDALVDPTFPLDAAAGYERAQRGNTVQEFAAVSIGIGAAAVAGSIALLFLREEPQPVAIVPMLGGVGVAGVLP